MTFTPIVEGSTECYSGTKVRFHLTRLWTWDVGHGTCSWVAGGVNLAEVNCVTGGVNLVLLGNQVVNFVILVFTAANELDEDEPLDDYCAEGPDAFKELILHWGDRKIGFDTKTKDKSVKDRQVAGILKTGAKIVHSCTHASKPYSAA